VRDELYWKYRVFKEPFGKEDYPDEELIGHPAEVDAKYKSVEDDGNGFEVWADMDEVEGDFFVLRPEDDHHARVAMAAYAYSCSRDYPHLAADIVHMLNQISWEEETGQHRDDIPVEPEDYIDTTDGEGDHLTANVVEFLRRRKDG
jgi:hypothetical protein